MESTNGILARVPGEVIGEAGHQLPAPSEEEMSDTLRGKAPERTVTLRDVRELGTVRITYRLNTHKHGKSRRWHWLAVHADQVSGGTTA